MPAHKNYELFLTCWQVGHKLGRQRSGTVSSSWVLRGQSGVHHQFSPVIKLGTGWVFKSQERKKERCGGFLYCTNKETKDPSDSGSRIL